MTVDAQILKALREAENGSISGVELSQSVGLTRAGVWARIQDLRTLGYEIHASPHLGYRLLSSPDLLHADDLMSRLGKDAVIGRDIRIFQETTSTNDVVEKLARDGVKKGWSFLLNHKPKAGGGSAENGFRRRAKDFGFPCCFVPTCGPRM